MPERKYIELFKSGALSERSSILKQRLHSCDICPRECHADRLSREKGFCQGGPAAAVASYCDHHGEEPAISGTCGSGTIFFSGCNLRCRFCQNYQISQGHAIESNSVTSEELSRIMLYLQDTSHCHNINLVSPTHFIPQIIEAICLAAPKGLHIPIIYNTNGYDSISTLRELDGIVDIYLPDMKYSSNHHATRFSQCGNYVQHSRAALLEMYRQVGNIECDNDGIAQRGLIVRHLILPNDLAGSRLSLRWLAKSLSPQVTISVMAQYYPSFLAMKMPELARKITQEEYQKVASHVQKLSFENGWLQEMDSPDNYLPDFDRRDHPFRPH